MKNLITIFAALIITASSVQVFACDASDPDCNDFTFDAPLQLQDGCDFADDACRD